MCSSTYVYLVTSCEEQVLHRSKFDLFCWGCNLAGTSFQKSADDGFIVKLKNPFHDSAGILSHKIILQILHSKVRAIPRSHAPNSRTFYELWKKLWSIICPDQITYTNLQKLYIPTGVGRVENSGGISHKHIFKSLNSTFKVSHTGWHSDLLRISPIRRPSMCPSCGGSVSACQFHIANSMAVATGGRCPSGHITK